MKTKLGRDTIGWYNSLIDISKFQDSLNLELRSKKPHTISICCECPENCIKGKLRIWFCITVLCAIFASSNERKKEKLNCLKLQETTSGDHNHSRSNFFCLFVVFMRLFCSGGPQVLYSGKKEVCQQCIWTLAASKLDEWFAFHSHWMSWSIPDKVLIFC